MNTTHHVHHLQYARDVHDVGGVPVTVDTIGTLGQGHPVLMLHGGGGPGTVAPWGQHLATTRNAHVLVPIHPGFNATPRPDAVGSIRDLADLYVHLLDALDLTDVTVVGNSIGGWIAAEIAALGSPRVSSVVLVDAVGLEVEGHPYADIFSLTPAELAERSYADPATYGLDPATLPDSVRETMAANRVPLASYGGSTMSDATLGDRLGGVVVPTLVVWGAADRIGEPAVGEAYAAAIPGARFRLIPSAGHLPQIETPQELAEIVWDFADAHATSKPPAATTIGIIGNGRVAHTLAEAWTRAGHPVLIASRSPGNGTVSLEEVVGSADVVVNATPGSVSVEALTAVEPALWQDTVVLDLANAVGPNLDLIYSDGSLAERIAAALPGARVVKSLNTAAMDVLADPGLLEPASVFVSGDDPEAKAIVVRLLRALGWDDDAIIDLGPLATARAAEHWFLMFAALMRKRGREVNLRIVGPRQ